MAWKDAAPAAADTGQQASTEALGPSTVEEGVDQCMMALHALMAATTEGQPHAIKTEAVLTVHRLNTCFLAARSFAHAVQLAERAVFGATSASHGHPGRAGPQPARSEQGSSSTGRCLMQALTEMLNIGEPHAILAVNCLAYLSSSRRIVQEVMDAAGLLPLLLGQLRHGAALEPVLQVAALRLVVTLVQAGSSGSAPRTGPLLQQHLVSLAGTATIFLHPDHQTVCQEAAVCLLEELVLTRAGARVIHSHEALRQAMQLAQMTARPEPAKHFCKRLTSVQKLAATLAPPLAPQVA